MIQNLEKSGQFDKKNYAMVKIGNCLINKGYEPAYYCKLGNKL